MLNSADESLRGEWGSPDVLLLASGAPGGDETGGAGGRKRPEPVLLPASGPVPFERISLLIDGDLILYWRRERLSAPSAHKATNRDNSTSALPVADLFLHRSQATRPPLRLQPAGPVRHAGVKRVVVRRMKFIITGGMQMKEDVGDRMREGDDQTAGEMSETEIDNNLEDTFPASDPPSWTLGSNHHSNLKPEPESDDEQ